MTAFAVTAHSSANDFAGSPENAGDGTRTKKEVNNGVTASRPFSDSAYGVTRGALMAP